jgi:hyperosmotically inducible protein
MDSQTSRKIIVAGGMAAVVLVGVVTFALRSHPVTSVAQTAQPPPPIAQVPPAAPGAAAEIPAAPAAAAQIPAAPAAVAQTPAAPAAVAKTPAAPAAVAHNNSVATKSADTATPPPAVEPKLAQNRHVAKAHTSTAATNGTVTRSGSAADTSEKPAAETVASSVDHVKSADESTPPPATSSSPADEQKVATSTEFAASDSQITTDVKSQIAGDSLTKDANIAVTTTHGVVALTGNLASQGAIDHVKDVAGKVKDVKSVDTSALILASL